MLHPDIDIVKESFRTYRRVPVARKFLCDSKTPIQIFEALAGGANADDRAPTAFMLESVSSDEKWGRYSFIGVNPDKILKNAPFNILEDFLEENASPVLAGMPKLTGGLVGYFSYDTVRQIEKTLNKNIPESDTRGIYDDIHMPDSYLCSYSTIVAYDHLQSSVIVIQNLRKSGDIDKDYADADKNAAKIMRAITSYVPQPAPSRHPKGDIKVTSNMTESEYITMVKKAQEYITAGDIFQVVLARRFEIENAGSAFDVYRMLRVTNPSPYLYYFRSPEFEIAGASPEMLVSVDIDDDGERVIKNKPIAGTIKRGSNAKEDAENEKKLLADPKERAEHTMLVDLGRNDVGRISKFGTVKVGGFMQTEKYSTVIHLVADVSGVLREDKTALDAVQSLLPAGTLSGAPKVRAMEIIDELENKKRGLYGGTVGYIGFDGVCDTCIAIRTVLFRNGKAYVGAGAGIVADSIPENEFAESRQKANSIINAVMEVSSL